jgi:hypothetical protein
MSDQPTDKGSSLGQPPRLKLVPFGLFVCLCVGLALLGVRVEEPNFWIGVLLGAVGVPVVGFLLFALVERVRKRKGASN